MKITRNPFSFGGMLSFGTEFDDMIENLTGAAGLPVIRQLPPLDVVEYDDRFEIVAELPGVLKEDLSITVLEGVINLTGERKSPAPKNDLHEMGKEIRYGKFSRSVRLPDGTNADAIVADLVDGVLRIVLPKAEETKPRNITVR